MAALVTRKTEFRFVLITSDFFKAKYPMVGYSFAVKWSSPTTPNISIHFPHVWGPSDGSLTVYVVSVSCGSQDSPHPSIGLLSFLSQISLAFASTCFRQCLRPIFCLGMQPNHVEAIGHPGASSVCPPHFWNAVQRHAVRLAGEQADF